MNRCLLIVSVALVCLGAAHAQVNQEPRTPPETRADNPLSTELKQAYNTVKNNLLKTADLMPEENYSFKPTPSIRSFGEVINHAAESQMRTCSAVLGSAAPSHTGAKTSKSDLVAALNAAFAQCDKAYDTLTDADASQMIKTPRGERSKLGMLLGNAIHDHEQYGILTVYLRLKGTVPPSSQH